MTILPQRLSNFLKELSQALALGWLCLRKFLCPKADSQGRWVWTALLPNRKDLNLISQRTATKGFQIFSDPSLSKQCFFKDHNSHSGEQREKNMKWFDHLKTISNEQREHRGGNIQPLHCWRQLWVTSVSTPELSFYAIFWKHLWPFLRAEGTTEE